MQVRVTSSSQLKEGTIVTLHHAIYGEDKYRVSFPGIYSDRQGRLTVMLIHEGCIMGVPHTLDDIGVYGHGDVWATINKDTRSEQ